LHKARARYEGCLPQAVALRKQTSRLGAGAFGNWVWSCLYLYEELGANTRVQLVVLTVRNSGVRGGSKVGLRKLVSKL
jgi:hypothetical protein